MSTINSVHMPTLLYLGSIQSTWPQSYIYDQSSPHGHILMSTINSVHMPTLLYLRSIQSTWPQSYIYDQSSPHGHTLMSTISSVHIIHTPVSTIKVLFFQLHLGFPNATLRGYRHRYTRNILKCRAAKARHPTVRQ